MQGDGQAASSKRFDVPNKDSSGARRAMWILIGLHGLLLLAMVPDYFADNDLGYHVSLGRQYGEHGHYFWDHLNWAPSGRPNLQGPLLHLAIGVVGRMLGGAGDDYVLAFSLLAIVQWSTAVFTAVFFSRRWAGDWAALFAVALLTGSIYSAASFFVGVPSGWIFLLTPWAIHFFLERRYLLSALFTSAVMYVHLGGSPVAPFGVFLAALFSRDWKGLLKVGGMCALLGAPMVIHFLRYLEWYNGQRGHVAGACATLTYLLALPGLILLLRQPRRNLFLLVWAIAPVSWFFQDNLRFFLQSTVVASVIASIFLARIFQPLHGRRVHTILAIVIVTLATVFPLSIPSLPVEVAWAAGKGFPRELDWNEARSLARVMDEEGVGDRIVHSYYDSLSAAMAVYSPLRQEFGHWGEVRPKVNPARDVSAGEKLYVLALPPNDTVLQKFASQGWIKVHGGSTRTTLATLPHPGSPEAVLTTAAQVIHEECQWLAQNTIPNHMPDPKNLFQQHLIEEFRSATTRQRNHAGRISVALLVMAHSLESTAPDSARTVRGTARGWGGMANFLGDETAIDYLSNHQYDLFRENVAKWGDAVVVTVAGELSDQEMRGLTEKLMNDFFGG